MEPPAYCYATFHSISQALKFETVFASVNRPVKLVPVPRIISSSCGSAARFSPEMLEDVTDMVKSGKVEVEGVYLLSKQGKKLVAEECTGPWGKG